MKITLVNCPYCNLNQKIFHISYNLKKFLNNFEKLEIFILGKFNKYQEIKKFNCDKCSMTLLIYYDIEKSKYFVNGERLEELRNSSTNTKKDIKILKGNKKWLFDWLKELNTKGRLIYKLTLEDNQNIIHHY